ncbi:unnamed protein product [Pocillopora meandrina]|uniref:Uncharacterized protein n=1 Tax=Pocillopora meandrina TaxID=46732 RepID=A0AAU9VYY3_9CNID|nr:unnamed protein product [Pocillopora meandrina]
MMLSLEGMSLKIMSVMALLLGLSSVAQVVAKPVDKRSSFSPVETSPLGVEDEGTKEENCPPGYWCRRSELVRDEETHEENCPPGYWCRRSMIPRNEDTQQKDCPPGDLECRRSEPVRDEKTQPENCPVGYWCLRSELVRDDETDEENCPPGASFCSSLTKRLLCALTEYFFRQVLVPLSQRFTVSTEHKLLIHCLQKFTPLSQSGDATAETILTRESRERSSYH